MPSENEQLVRWAISGVNMLAHDFSNDFGSMSQGEDLFGNELNTFNASAEETSRKATSGEPVYGLGVWNRLRFIV